MTITIANILDSDLAIYHEEGLLIYTSLQAAFEKGEKITISFVGLAHCSTQFLNASVGKLYLLNDPTRVDNLLHFEYGDSHILKLKVIEVRENAINSKHYDALLENMTA